jgi:hypothetical protein
MNSKTLDSTGTIIKAVCTLYVLYLVNVRLTFPTFPFPPHLSLLKFPAKPFLPSLSRLPCPIYCTSCPLFLFIGDSVCCNLEPPPPQKKTSSVRESTSLLPGRIYRFPGPHNDGKLSVHCSFVLVFVYMYCKFASAPIFILR